MSSSTDGFTHLVARFTAERDELMHSVQQCQERVTDLVARLTSLEHVGPDAAPQPDVASPAVGEFRETAEARLDGLEEELGGVLERLSEVRNAQTRMEVVMDQWMQVAQGAATADRDPEIPLLRERIETLTENLARVSDAMGELGAMRASLAGMHRRIDELGTRADTGEAPDGVFDAIERLRTDVEALRAEVARSARPDATAGLVQGLSEVRHAVAGLKNQMRTLDAAVTTGLRSTTARWDGEARALAGKIEDVSRLFTAHAEAHRHSLQERAAEWARIAGTMVETELRWLGEHLPQPERVVRTLRARRLLPEAPWRLLGR